MILTIFISIFGLILGNQEGAYDDIPDCKGLQKVLSRDREIRINKKNHILEKCKIRLSEEDSIFERVEEALCRNHRLCFRQNSVLNAEMDNSDEMSGYNQVHHRRRRSEDDSYVDWAVYVVVLVLIILPILGILYCACKSTMPTSSSVSPVQQNQIETKN